MRNKLFWFYRISTGLILLFISLNILVKSVIWFQAFKHDNYEESQYAIRIRKQFTDEKFTTKQKQNLFHTVDHLLTPAFILMFSMITMKLVKKPNIFELDESN